PLARVSVSIRRAIERGVGPGGPSGENKGVFRTCFRSRTAEPANRVAEQRCRDTAQRRRSSPALKVVHTQPAYLVLPAFDGRTDRPVQGHSQPLAVGGGAGRAR